MGDELLRGASMKPEFICHGDFARLKPVNVFHKERKDVDLSEKDEKYLNRHILFRKSFFADKTKNARLRITADD